MSERFLLDSHIVLWMALNDPQLEARVLARLVEPGTPLLVSTAGIAELCIKASSGKLTLPFGSGVDARTGFEEILDRLEIAALPITMAHAVRLRDLPLHHRDPFDRLMIAQATAEGLTMVTHDRAFARYEGLSVLWS